MRNNTICLSLITIGSSSRVSFVLKQILISLHFVSFSWNLSEAAREANVSTAVCMLLACPLSIVPEIVESSAYFHRSKPGMSRSLIIIMKSQVPNLAPWGTPAGHHATLKKNLDQVSLAVFDNTGSQ